MESLSSGSWEKGRWTAEPFGIHIGAEILADMPWSSSKQTWSLEASGPLREIYHSSLCLRFDLLLELDV